MPTPKYIHKKLIVFQRVSVRLTLTVAGKRWEQEITPEEMHGNRHTKGTTVQQNLEHSVDLLYTHGAGQDNKTQVEQRWTGQNNQDLEGKEQREEVWTRRKGTNLQNGAGNNKQKG